MSDDQKGTYGIGELAQLAGVTRRTVRYYVQRGLLPAPTGTGRGKHYTQAHLDALMRIRQLQEAGTPLAEIAAQSGGPDATAPPARPTPSVRPSPRYGQWTRIEIADGVELHLRDVRLDSDQVRALARAVMNTIEGPAPARRLPGGDNE